MNCFESALTMRMLMDLYCQLSVEEGLQLTEFVDRIKAHEFGERTKDEVVAFLRQLEDEMLLNIEDRIAGSPHLESERETRIERVRSRIQTLVDSL